MALINPQSSALNKTMADLRLFVAVVISDGLKRKIAKVQDEFRKAARDVKWVVPENFHVTVKFLGNVSEDRLGDISDAVSAAVEGISPFDVKVAGAGAFPNVKKPSVVWIGLKDGAEALKELAAKVETELEKADFPKEERSFKAHVTIGRVKDARNVRDLPEVIKAHQDEGFGTQRVDRLVLMKSNLTREGSIYSALREFPFPGV